jgi:hypothetical protein
MYFSEVTHGEIVENLIPTIWQELGHVLNPSLPQLAILILNSHSNCCKEIGPRKNYEPVIGGADNSHTNVDWDLTYLGQVSLVAAPDDAAADHHRQLLYGD